MPACARGGSNWEIVVCWVLIAPQSCIDICPMSEMRGHFSVEADPSELLRLIPQIKKLADAEKNALGFLPEQAIRDAVIRKCLFAITVGDEGSNEVAGYLLHSGVFPHAKIQQIATSPNFRNQQVGSSLIRYLVSELERFGFMSIKAEVASDLEGALKFYAKNGKI